MEKEAALSFIKRRLPDVTFIAFMILCFHLIADQPDEKPEVMPAGEETLENPQVSSQATKMPLAPKKEVQRAKTPTPPFPHPVTKKPPAQNSLNESFKQLQNNTVSEDALKARNDYFNKLSLQLKELQKKEPIKELDEIIDEEIKAEAETDFPIDIPEDLQGFDDERALNPDDPLVPGVPIDDLVENE